MALPQHLTDFLSTHPSIKVVRRSDPDFDSIKQVFIVTSAEPLLIARPQNDADVAALVTHLTTQSVPIVVRAGGHDLSARSVQQDAVQIDLRDIRHLRVAEDKSTAYIGGGILSQDVLDGLAAESLMTPAGNAGTVGWTSWAMNGGYGIMAAKYGLGCDQIVGARVVLADGSLVQADERLLKAMRGAGANFGVVVELQIKVYPLTQITSGVVMCASTDGLQTSLATFFDQFRAVLEGSGGQVPPELYFQHMIMPVPVQGPSFAFQFVWAGPPSDQQKEWLDKLAPCVPAGMPQVGPTTPAEYMRYITAMVDSHCLGGEARTVSLRSLVPSAEAAAVITKHASLVTPDYGAVFVHSLHGTSVLPDKKHPADVFASREPHQMVEILGLAFREHSAKEPATSWARNFCNELRTVDGAMGMAYFPLTQDSALDLETTFEKDGLSFLRELKEELDPTNVFRFPMPLAK